MTTPYFTDTNVTTNAASTPVYTLADTDTLFVGEHATLAALGVTSDVITAGNGANSTQIAVNGDLYSSSGAGIRWGTGNQYIAIGETASITATFGLTGGGGVTTPTTHIDNAGVIVGRTDGIVINGGRGEIVNSGKIHGDVNWGVATRNVAATFLDVVNAGEIIGKLAAISAGAGGASIVNNGLLSSQGQGISLGGLGAGPFHYDILNTGTISAAYPIYATAPNLSSMNLTNTGILATVEGYAAVTGNDGRDVIINSGAIIGDVSLRFGADTFDTSAGIVSGYIDGGGDNDNLIGSRLDDRLDGGLGNDVLRGGAGNDLYFVDSTADQVIEAVGGGTDTVNTSVSCTLARGQEIENLVLTGSVGSAERGNEFDNHITGNNGVDTLDGDLGNDWLDGGAAADTMRGGEGDDWYFVDTAGDLALELAGEGNDRVFAHATFVLQAGSEIEKLTVDDYASVAAINLTGNEFTNVLAGNAGANTLDGKGGADVMIGFGGDDQYIVDNAGDQVCEWVGGGNDRVLASVSYTLAASQEIERLATDNNAGTAAINLSGNEFANIITGNAAANTLDGKGGVDTLIGLEGDDFYFVDSSTDSVVEAAAGGVDRVFTSASYTLPAGQEIEKLSTNNNSGTGVPKLAGNEFGNLIFGNAGDNAINGGLGNDTLVGLGGANAFLFNTTLNAATNVDQIADFSVPNDTIQLGQSIFSTLALGALPASAFYIGAAAHAAADRIIYNSVTGSVLYDSDGTGAAAATAFATVAAGLAMTSADFLVVL